MDAFAAHQQDEGYSEDPLNQSSATSSFKQPRYDGADPIVNPSRPGSDIPAWLIRHIAGLSDEEKSGAYLRLCSSAATTCIELHHEYAYRGCDLPLCLPSPALPYPVLCLPCPVLCLPCPIIYKAGPITPIDKLH
jgi:hypothetical protein